VELVFHKGIETLTVYGFSTENRKRSQPEVDALMKIFTDYLIEMNERLKNENVKVNVLGNISVFDTALYQAIIDIQENTKHKTAHTFNLCLNYGGRADIIQACQVLARKVQNEGISPHDINEQQFSDHLYTAGQTDPDLIIRTS
jgi:undecaprenyl diphosphate synthase